MKTNDERDDGGVFAARIGLGLRELDGRERAPDVAAEVVRRIAAERTPPARSMNHRLAWLAAMLAVGVTATLLFQRRWVDTAGQPDGAVAALPESGGPQDPVPAAQWRLVYELGEQGPGRPDGTAEQFAATVSTLQRRIGALATVARGDGATIVVTFADATAHVMQAARDLLEDPGRLEMRAVADAAYAGDGGKVRFDLDAERRHLQAWLDQGGRARLQQDLRALDEHRPGSAHLRWAVHKVRPSGSDGALWGHRLADVPKLAESTVAAYEASDWNGGALPAAMLQRPVASRFLVELVAVNLHERHFRETDVDPTTVAAKVGPDEQPCVQFGLVGASAAEYADFSEKLIGRHCAFLWNGEVLSAPCFLSRIAGVGQIHGLGATEAATIARILSTPVADRPRLLRSDAGAGR